MTKRELLELLEDCNMDDKVYLSYNRFNKTLVKEIKGGSYEDCIYSDYWESLKVCDPDHDYDEDEIENIFVLS